MSRRDPGPTAPPDDSMIFAEVSPISLGQALIGAAAGATITEETVTDFYSHPAAQDEAVRRLRDRGFLVPHPRASPLTLTIGGSRAQYWDVFGVQLEQVQVARPDDRTQGAANPDVQSYWTPSDAATDPGYFAEPPQAMAGVIEGVVFPQPAEFHRPAGAATLPQATPPTVGGYFYLNVPDDVARLLRADGVQRGGLTGAGVTVAMIDSGHYTAHPFFARYREQIEPVVRDAEATLRGLDPLQDPNGHGTMESANLFALAPGCTLMPIMSLLNNPVDAFKVARLLRPQIITCSWGYEMRGLMALRASDRPLQAEIADAVRNGIVVIYSAGNGQVAWPAMHPDVIACGGAYVDRDGRVCASDYASSFLSPIFPERAVPDVAGLVGMLPDAKYIMLPGQPGCAVDVKYATRFNDGTAPDDGWAVISGTSAAAPQIAGIVALLLQAAPGLRPAQVKTLLRRTARDVTTGHTNPAAALPDGPHESHPGADLATGSGLVDTGRAVALARLQTALARPAPVPPLAPPAPAPVGATPTLPQAAINVALGPGTTGQVLAANATAGPPAAAPDGGTTVEITVRLVLRVEVASVEVQTGAQPVGPLPPVATPPPVLPVAPAVPAGPPLNPALVQAVLDDPTLAALVREALAVPGLDDAALAARLATDAGAQARLAALLDRDPPAAPLSPTPAAPPVAAATLLETPAHDPAPA